MSEQSITKPLLVTIVSALILAPVTSHLAVLGFQVWRDSKQKRNQSEQIFTILQTEIEQNLYVLNREIAMRYAKLKAVSRLFELRVAPGDTPSEEWDRLLYATMEDGAAYFSTAIVDSYILGNRSFLVDNPALSKALVSYDTNIHQAAHVDTWDRNLKTSTLVPYFIKNGSLAQILATDPGRPDGTRLHTFEIEHDFHLDSSMEHSTLVDNSEFVGILAELSEIQRVVLGQFEDLRQELTQLQATLKTEMQIQSNAH